MLTKSLDAYNYFISGHIKEIQLDPGNDLPVLFIKSLVDAGQRQSCAPYNPWILLDKKKGYVMTAHCTCMAGCGEACSHIAAVLFALEQLTRDGENCEEATTSIKCIWVILARCRSFGFEAAKFRIGLIIIILCFA